jgi:hypothetical protein
VSLLSAATGNHRANRRPKHRGVLGFSIVEATIVDTSVAVSLMRESIVQRDVNAGENDE